MTLKTRAIVQIGHGRRNESDHLKRLSLFFDEIYFVLPTFWLIKEDVLDNPQRVERLDNELIRIIGGIDPIRDTDPALLVPVTAFEGELRHCLDVLVDQGKAVEYRPLPIADKNTEHLFREVRHRLAWEDAKDPTFTMLSGTNDSEYQSEYIPLRFTIYEDDRDVPTGQEILQYAVIPPSAIADSVELTTVLFAAQTSHSSPVFIDPVRQAELARRYENYKSGLAVLRDRTQGVVSAAEFHAQFGAVTFQMSNSIIDSERIRRLSIEDIVRLRSTTDDSRRRFVSEHLVAATELVENNPWEAELQDELERFVRGPLSADLMRFEEDSRHRYESMFGRFSGPIADVARGAFVGGGIGALGAASGIEATVLPSVSPWQMALIASLGGAVKHAPEIVGTVIETIVEQRRANRSSIAYLASVLRFSS